MRLGTIRTFPENETCSHSFEDLNLKTPEAKTAAARVENRQTAGRDVSSTHSRDRSLAGSLAWKAVADWASQILSWASFLIVVRLLAPADFGVVAMAMAVLPYLRCVGDFGVTRVIINFPDLSDEQIGQLHTFSSALGVACFSLAAAASYPIALFFRTPKLAGVVTAASFALVLWGLRAVPEGLLTRELKFRLVSIFDAVNAIIAAVVTLALAYFGYGYWALVFGNIAGIAVRTVMILVARPQRFAFPRIAEIRQQLQFGWHLLVSLVAMNSYQTLDNVTVGRVLGRSALGFYGMAWNLANVPLEKITSLVTTVIPSYLALVQKQPEEIRRYLGKLTEAMSLITFPATIGLGLVARELVPVAFGHKWDSAVPPLQILSMYAAFRSIVALLPKVLTAVGNPRFVMWCDLLAVCTLPIAFVAGSHWGTAGVALGWVVAYPVVALPLYWKTFTTIGMKASEYISAVRPAIDGSAFMIAVVLLLKWKMPVATPLVVQLAAEIVAGAIIYVTIEFLFYRQRILVFLQLALTFRNRKSGM